MPSRNALEPYFGSKRLSLEGLSAAGLGLGGFTTVFNAEAEPAWLKSVALQFAVVASKVLDEAVPDCTKPSMSGSRPQIASSTHKQRRDQTASAEQVCPLVGNP